MYTTDKNPSPSPNHIPHDLKHVLLKIHNIHVDTYPIQSTMLDYNINYSKELQLAPPPKHTHVQPNPIARQIPNNTRPTLKYNPLQCIYTYGSFNPPTKNAKGNIVGNIAKVGINNPNNNICIA